MLRAVLESVENLVLERPRTVLVAAVILSALAVLLGSGIELRTSRREMVPRGDPDQARWDALRREFNGPEPLIVALNLAEGVPAERGEAAAAAIAEALRDEPIVSRVFYRIDTDWVTEHALYLAPAEGLETAAAELERMLGADEEPIRLHGFARLNEHLADRIEQALATGSAMPSNAGQSAADRLRQLLRWERRMIEDPEGFDADLSESPFGLIDTSEHGSLTDNGYLRTYDGRTLFVLVSLRGDDGDPNLQRNLVSLVRRVTNRVLSDTAGITFGLTGTPAMKVEEMAAIGRDGRRTSMFATAGVFLLSLLAFRRMRHALLGLATLVAGVTWSVGAVRLELGYLNMITTALVPILVGMGIDYAVHPISQFELEPRASRRDAVRATFRKTSAAIVVSALTTSAAFFCFLFMEYRGFSELGLVTGIGVLLCLLAALLVLPALLMLFGTGATTREATVDRVWDLGLARRICARPRTVLLVGAVVTAAGLWSGAGVRLDSNLLELLPAGAESLRYLRRVNDDSALSSNFNLVAAGNIAQLRQLRDRAEPLDPIDRFESVLTFLPPDPARSATAIARVAHLLGRIRLDDPGPVDPGRLADSLHRLENVLANAADQAFVTGLGKLSASLDQARAEAHTAASLLADPAGADPGRSPTRPEDEAQRLTRAEQRLRRRAASVLAALERAVHAAPPTLATLPAEIRDRLVTSRGRLLGYLYPKGDMYDPEFLHRFNTASRRVQASAIGFPVLFEDHATRITHGFVTAFLVGALLVTLLLGIDLRSSSHTALAMLPVVVGTIWMLGLMRALGLVFNFANLVAVPIVIGVGIDSGVHLVHRFRLEGDAGIDLVLAHTGRAILIASLTTMVGFGSLALATHRGMQSLGVLLLIGVGTNLVASLVMLPCVLAILRRRGSRVR